MHSERHFPPPGARRTSSSDAPKSCLVVGIVSANSGSGNTLDRIIQSFAESGYRVDSHVESELSLASIARCSARIFNSQASVLYLRFSPYLVPAVLVSRMFRRRGGERLVVHVPTPVKAGYRERLISLPRAKAVSINSLTRMMYPIACWLAAVVLQNGEASPPDARWIRQKTVLAANPTQTNSSTEFALAPTAFRSAPYKIVGVASNGYYHGYDRIIQGMLHLQTTSNSIPLHLTLVGPNSAFLRERQLIEAHPALRSSLSFLGPLRQSEVDEMLCAVDAALGLLGCHRINLASGSPLRHRTYLLNGTPWVTSLKDVDPALQDRDWILEVPADDSAISPARIVAWLEGLNSQSVLNSMRSATAVVLQHSIAGIVDKALNGHPSAGRVRDAPHG